MQPPEQFPSLPAFLLSAGVAVPALLEAFDFYLVQLRNYVATFSQMDEPASYIEASDYLLQVETARAILAATGPMGDVMDGRHLGYDPTGSPSAGRSGEGPSEAASAQ